MKTPIFSVLFHIVSITGIAQFSINSSHFPTINDTLHFNFCDTINITAGNEGANQIWDFENITPLTKQWEILFHSPDYNVNAGAFPMSTLEFMDTQSENSWYWQLQNDTLIQNGMIDVQSQSRFAYTDELILMPLPFSYGDEFHDSFSGEADEANTHGGHNTSIKGSYSIKADGYGTLLLPTGNYESLRTHSIENRQDSTNILPHPGGLDQVINHHIETWSWYLSEGKWPILSISKHHRIINNSIKSLYIEARIFSHKDLTLNSKPQVNTLNISLFPNPSDGNFYLISNKLIGSINISIMTIEGTLLFNKTITPSPSMPNILSVPDRKGTVLVKITSEETSSTIPVQLF